MSIFGIAKRGFGKAVKAYNSVLALTDKDIDNPYGFLARGIVELYRFKPSLSKKTLFLSNSIFILILDDYLKFRFNQ